MKVHLLQALLLILTFFLQLTFSHKTFCGKIPIQTPFSLQISTKTHTLNQMFFCKSHKLYFKNSLGLFQISSINYSKKLLILSHISSRFTETQNPSNPNSMLLFKCSKKKRVKKMAYLRKCHWGKGAKLFKGFSCLVVNDFGKIDMGFHPNEMNCSNHKAIERKHGFIEKKKGEFKLRARVSFEVDNHVPNPCDECEKDNGNCGVALRCICHPRMCKEKVISLGTKVNYLGKILIMSFIAFTIMILV